MAHYYVGTPSPADRVKAVAMLPLKILFRIFWGLISILILLPIDVLLRISNNFGLTFANYLVRKLAFKYPNRARLISALIHGLNLSIKLLILPLIASVLLGLLLVAGLSISPVFFAIFDAIVITSLVAVPLFIVALTALAIVNMVISYKEQAIIRNENMYEVYRMELQINNLKQLRMQPLTTTLVLVKDFITTICTSEKKPQGYVYKEPTPVADEEPIIIPEGYGQDNVIDQKSNDLLYKHKAPSPLKIPPESSPERRANAQEILPESPNGSSSPARSLSSPR